MTTTTATAARDRDGNSDVSFCSHLKYYLGSQCQTLASTSLSRRISSPRRGGLENYELRRHGEYTLTDDIIRPL